MNKVVDILIIGAGISGVGVAVHLKNKCSDKSLAIIEAREAVGGTWDLFKYPGIRSDSDMTTFGYNFKPWNKISVLADGASIKNYVNETVEEYQLEDLIHFKHRVKNANYNNNTKKWEVEILNEKGITELWITNFVIGCTGYYNYEKGYQPVYPDQNNFKGQVIHPQHWPENLDYQNKKIVIIGSGATAITLVPAMLENGAGHITMLQRSPTYIASISSVDDIYKKMRSYLPEKVAYKLARAKNIATQRGVYALAQKQPKLVKKVLLKATKKMIGEKGDIKDFTPSYNPWDQRLCVVPDADLFQCIKNGSADVITDHIDRFTEKGILLQSGKHVDADIIVSATGLNIQILGGIETSVDNVRVDTSKTMLYQGIMVSDVPNMAMMIGYINASWTLKVDIAADYLCRLFNYMDKKSYTEVVAKADKSQMLDDTVMGSLSSGYIARAKDVMPKQGRKVPWKMTNNYLLDRKTLKSAKFEDDILHFS
jgi:monooxygenase